MRHSWKGWLPADVLADLRNERMYRVEWILDVRISLPDLPPEARGEARKGIRAYQRRLRGRVRAGKRWIHERWPGWWTPAVEMEFKEWLY